MVLKDLHVVDGDLVLTGGDPETLDGADVVGQDIKHRIIESGLANDFVGSETEDEGVLKIELVKLVEDDRRVEPGTVEVSQEASQEGSRLKVSCRLLGGESVGMDFSL